MNFLPCSSYSSLFASLRQNKPGAFDWSVMDDFAEWKMTGYFLKSITAASTVASKTAGLSGTKGELR